MVLGLFTMFAGIMFGYVMARQMGHPTDKQLDDLHRERLSAEVSAETTKRRAAEEIEKNMARREEWEQVRQMLAPLPREATAEVGPNPDPWKIFTWRRERVLADRQRRLRIIKALDDWARTVDPDRRSLAQINPHELGLSDDDVKALRDVLGR